MAEGDQTFHATARSGFVEGSNYDQFRPSYSDALVQHVVDSLLSDSQMAASTEYDIVEFGAGTGLFTRAMLKKLPKNCRYLATEPSTGFLETLKTQTPEAHIKECTAANCQLPDNSVKNVVCAQCFHWFANETSLKEIHRILVPGGKLVFVWNNKKWDEPWVGEMEDVLTLYYGDTPRMKSYVWKSVIEGFKGFSLVDHRFLPGVDLTGPVELVLKHYATISVIAQLDETEKEGAMEKFMAVIEKYFTTKEKQNITIPNTSEFYCTQKT